MIRAVPQSIPDVLLVEPDMFRDERGYFSETYRADVLASAGFHDAFVQDNLAYSAANSTLRGLHFQAGEQCQAKLVRAARGAILDVAVDIRVGSPWYGQAVVVELSAMNRLQLLVPQGFAHGYLTLTDHVEVCYKVTAYYAAHAEGGLLWSDPALAIEWGVDAATALVNLRDRSWPALADLASPFRYEARE